MNPILVFPILVLTAVLQLKAAEDSVSAQAKALNQSVAATTSAPNPEDDQWFPHAGLGLFIHWGLTSVKGVADISWCMMANKPWKDLTLLPSDYYAVAKEWHPDNLDYNKILSQAKPAGFTYAVMVTKHHDGFTLWPSNFGDIGTKQSLNGRDFVKEFAEACRANGLKVGLYYSPPDWWFDRKYRNWSMTSQTMDMDHNPAPLQAKPPGHDAKRVALVQGQLKELLTQYGKIDLIWFDGGQGELPNSEVRKLQPGIVINRRNGGPGDYGDSEGRLPGSRFQGWFESCVPCWPMRMWTYRTEYGSYDAPMVLTMISILRAWGGNLLANVGPRGDGMLPEGTSQCWNAMAEWMTKNREAIYDIRPGPWPVLVDQPVTIADRVDSTVAYVHFLPNLPEAPAGVPSWETQFTKTRDIIPCRPAFTRTATWHGVPAPISATLLRTGGDVPFAYDGSDVKVTLPEVMSSGSVDVVKLTFTKPLRLPPLTTVPVENPSSYSSRAWESCVQRVAAAKDKPIDILFIGDSITQNFSQPPTDTCKLVGDAAWNKHYAHRNTLNYGVGTDGTEHLLWRMNRLDVSWAKPKVIVLEIGVNDLDYAAKDIAAGIRAVLDKCLNTFPKAKIVLMAILPNNRNWQRTQEVNSLTRTFADNNHVFWLDIADSMPLKGGEFSCVGPDRIHLKPEGYEIWASKLTPLIDALLSGDVSPKAEGASN